LKNLVESVKGSKTNFSNNKNNSDINDIILMSAIMGGTFVASQMLYANELYPKAYTDKQIYQGGDGFGCGSSGCSSSCSSSSCGGGSSCSSGCGGCGGD
ncbi:MAG: hypothetical protein KDK36_15840, partial [Leptospiraceae bacterium]|nr:hypothetical protein [Leptospiraceae bacterium]